MIAALRKKVGAFVPIAWEDSDIDAFYNVVYLSCLLLFDKPGYMAVPVAEHFARPKVAGFMRTIDYRPLEDTEQQKLSALRDSYSGLRDLTNPEMDFVVSLYERGRK